jgi:glycosyltransferase involved in cell wall biosynthesis
MPRFSLIVPTLGRTEEAEKLFASLVEQKRSDLELIVVDQNDDDRLLPVLKDLPQNFSVIHLKQQEKNVSLARNKGMDAATGEILAFPDDDCW